MSLWAYFISLSLFYEPIFQFELTYMDPTFSTLAAALQIEISASSLVVKFIHQPRYYENLFQSYNSFVQNSKPRA